MVKFRNGLKQRQQAEAQVMRQQMQEELIATHPQIAKLDPVEKERALIELRDKAELKRKKRLKEHLEFFTDAIVAIIITIMLLEIPIPGEGHTYHEFIWGVIVFLTSFFIMADFWFDHHKIFDGVEAVTEWIVILDFIYTGFLSIIPLLTKWLMVGVSSLTIFNFGVVLIVVKLLQYALRLEVSKIRFKQRPQTLKIFLRYGRLRFWAMLFWYGLIILVGRFIPAIGYWFFIGVPLVSFIFSHIANEHDVNHIDG
jgi:uncharacterized membrane protein